MNKKAKDIVDMLEELYPETPIPLDHVDNFTLLISVLLSAQCTDERVNQVTPALWRLANNPKDMAEQDVDDIRDIIKPCGLSPTKSRAIKETSRIITEKYGGQVPESFEDLEQLPGVGHKTASVVMSQGFGHPAFPVDTHIHRLAIRWGLTKGKSVVHTEADCKKAFPKYLWNKLHLQIIFYGRAYCPARGHVLDNCPICMKYAPKVKKKPVPKEKG
jgi:endonuclease III